MSHFDVHQSGHLSIAAAALKCMGGEQLGRLWPRNERERKLADETGHDLTRVLSADDLVQTDNCYFAATGVAEIVGGEALPQTVLERLIYTAAVTGIVFDGKGQPLWVGRTHRHATEAQTNAIIARDRHCRGKGCTAGPERCEIHHIVPWEQGGRTNIDEMCLACPLCHHNIHDRGYIVIKTNTGYQIINPNNPPNGP